MNNARKQSVVEPSIITFHPKKICPFIQILGDQSISAAQDIPYKENLISSCLEPLSLPAMGLVPVPLRGPGTAPPLWHALPKIPHK